MKLTLERSVEGMTVVSTNPNVSTELPWDDLTISEVLDHLVVPLLVAWGYDEGSILSAMEGIGRE